MAAASAELPVCGHEFYAFFYQSIFLVVLESTMVKNVVLEVVVTRSRQEMVKMQFFYINDKYRHSIESSIDTFCQ